MKRFTAVLLMGLTLMLILSACGSSNNGSNGTTLNITMTDFKYDPSAWTVPAGKPVTVNLKNTGTVPHTWTVMSKPVSGSYTAADQANVLFDSGVIASGASKTVTFNAPGTPGTYQVICTQPGHIEAGMVGQLTVQ